MDPEADARELVRERFPAARAAFLGGGILSERRTPPERAELDRRRCGLSDVLDDLAGSSDPGETAVICWYLLCETAELPLLLDGSWLGGGKWLLRELRAAEPRLAEELIEARDDPARLASLAEAVLARAGGRLWAGYRQVGKL